MKEVAPVLFDASALVLFAVAAFLLIVGRKWAGARASTALLGAVACALMGNAERLEMVRFSVTGGLEAKIHQLDVGLKELQQIAAAAAKANLTALAMSGQIMSGLQTQTKFEIRDNIISSLKAVDVSGDQLNDVQKIWIGVYCNLLLGDIITEAMTGLPTAMDEIGNLPRNVDYDLPEPTALEEWVRSRSLSSDRLSPLLQEYRRLWTTGSLRDPSIIPFNRVMMELPHH
jgi:hypothetical protein